MPILKKSILKLSIINTHTNFLLKKSADYHWQSIDDGFFNEPTSALDPQMIGEVLRVISDLPKTNTP